MTPSLFGWITSYVAYIQHMRWRGVAHHFHDQRSKVVPFFYHVRSVAQSLFHWFTSYEIHAQPMRSQCAAHHFQIKRTKVKVIGVIWTLLCLWFPAYLTELLHIWLTYNTWGADVSCTIFRTKGQRSRSYGSFDFLTCPLCSSIPISPIQLIWYTHNPWGHNVSCTISRSKCQRSWSHGWFEVFAPWLPPYLTKSCHMCHTHNIWGCNVSRPIFRMKGQRSRPHGSLQMLLIDMYHRGSP